MPEVVAFAEEAVVEVEEEENDHDAVEISVLFPKLNQLLGEAREKQRRSKKPPHHAMRA